MLLVTLFSATVLIALSAVLYGVSARFEPDEQRASSLGGREWRPPVAIDPR